MGVEGDESNPVDLGRDAAVDDVARAGRFQMSLATLLLLTTFLATAVANLLVFRESRTLRTSLVAQNAFDRELIVRDPNVFTGVGRVMEMHGEYLYDINVPDGDFEVCVGTTTIPDAGRGADVEIPKAIKSIALPPGRQLVEIYRKQSEYLVVTFKVRIAGKEIDVPTNINPNGGYQIHRELDRCREFQLDEAFELMHQIEGTAGPKNPGCVVWIRPREPN